MAWSRQEAGCAPAAGQCTLTSMRTVRLVGCRSDVLLVSGDAAAAAGAGQGPGVRRHTEHCTVLPGNLRVSASMLRIQHSAKVPYPGLWETCQCNMTCAIEQPA